MLLFISMAHALSSFPGMVSDHLAMPCVPSCLLCHETPAGGSGTATQDFVLNLEAEGFDYTDAATLAAAVDAVQAGAYDADADGVNDVDELLVGGNPNPGGVDFCAVDGPPEVTRGCFGNRGSGDSGGAYAVGVGLAVWAMRARRARR